MTDKRDKWYIKRELKILIILFWRKLSYTIRNAPTSLTPHSWQGVTPPQVFVSQHDQRLTASYRSRRYPAVDRKLYRCMTAVPCIFTYQLANRSYIDSQIWKVEKVSDSLAWPSESFPPLDQTDRFNDRTVINIHLLISLPIGHTRIHGSEK